MVILGIDLNNGCTGLCIVNNGVLNRSSMSYINTPRLTRSNDHEFMLHNRVNTMGYVRKGIIDMMKLNAVDAVVMKSYPIRAKSQNTVLLSGIWLNIADIVVNTLHYPVRFISNADLKIRVFGNDMISSSAFYNKLPRDVQSTVDGIKAPRLVADRREYKVSIARAYYLSCGFISSLKLEHGFSHTIIS